MDSESKIPAGSLQAWQVSYVRKMIRRYRELIYENLNKEKARKTKSIARKFTSTRNVRFTSDPKALASIATSISSVFLTKDRTRGVVNDTYDFNLLIKDKFIKSNPLII